MQVQVGSGKRHPSLRGLAIVKSLSTLSGLHSNDSNDSNILSVYPILSSERGFQTIPELKLTWGNYLQAKDKDFRKISREKVQLPFVLISNEMQNRLPLGPKGTLRSQHTPAEGRFTFKVHSNVNAEPSLQAAKGSKIYNPSCFLLSYITL